MSKMQVVVAGCGPAGLITATALAEAGASVLALDPAPDTQWPNQYACWRDEWDDAQWPGAFETSWSTARVLLPGDRSLAIAREYARIDGRVFKASLLDRLAKAGGRIAEAHVSSAQEVGEWMHVQTAQGFHRANVVIDATGHFPALVRRPPRRPTAWQTAYGVLARLDASSATTFDPQEMWLFDYRPLPNEGHNSSAPSFLYAMPLGQGHVFLEETVLIADPPVPIRALKQKLHARLAALGIGIERVVAVERCAIPMNSPLPYADQLVVAVGAAASQVHPATGYLVAHCASQAPRLASALTQCWNQGARDPASLAKASWRVVWPREAQRAHALYNFGARTVAGFSRAELADFFNAFFSIPEPEWAGYLSRRASASQLSSAMWTLYRTAPAHLRSRLRAAGYASLGALTFALTGLGRAPVRPPPAS